MQIIPDVQYGSTPQSIESRTNYYTPYSMMPRKNTDGAMPFGRNN